MNHTEDAKEIVQDTFLKVYRHIKAFRELEREETIGMIVIYTRNTSLDFLRKKARRIKAGTLTYEDEDEVKEYEIPDDQDTPDESAVSSRLNRAKAKLREMIGGGADEQDFKNR